jgi:hypothetical protein
VYGLKPVPTSSHIGNEYFSRLFSPALRSEFFPCKGGKKGNPGLQVAVGRQHGAISYVEMCEISEISGLSVLLLTFRRGDRAPYTP